MAQSEGNMQETDHLMSDLERISHQFLGTIMTNYLEQKGLKEQISSLTGL